MIRLLQFLLLVAVIMALPHKASILILAGTAIFFVLRRLRG